MWAEFKEKTYEKYFGHELARRTKITYSPDQVDERFLAFDEAFFLNPAALLEFFPSLGRARSSGYHGFSLRELDRLALELSEFLPPFKFNLFIQYKRPEFLTRSTAEEWSTWHRRYYRFHTTPHQQTLLEQLEHSTVNRASVIYASPAFWKSEDLWNLVSNSGVVAESNIVFAGSLKGHGCYSYIGAGAAGVGHSEPASIEGPSIDQILEKELSYEGNRFDLHLKKSAAQIEEAIFASNSDIAAFELARSSYLSGWIDRGEEPNRDSVGYALATIAAFSEIYEISFNALG